MNSWKASLSSRALAGFAAALLGCGGADAGTVTYTYDALGRLLGAAYPDGTCTAYLYDAAGSRSQYASQSGGAPLANPATISGYLNLAVVFDPRVGDPSCSALTITGVGTPAHGAASVNSGGGSITYTPASGYTGSDSFTYTISNAAGTATGTVTTMTNAPTLAPVALGGFMIYRKTIPPPPSVTPSVTVNIASFASDPYGYPLTLASVTQGANGTVTFSGMTATYLYGSAVAADLFTNDSFTYTVSDGHGHNATGTVNIAIRVISMQ